MSGVLPHPFAGRVKPCPLEDDELNVPRPFGETPLALFSNERWFECLTTYSQFRSGRWQRCPQGLRGACPLHLLAGAPSPAFFPEILVSS